ncbi:MAG: hypothetical protein AVDCRST_MAG96-1123, partial [uncultured Segetibacter sp.]
MSINRRRFLQTTTTALMLSLNSFASPRSTINADSNFKLKILATNWGFKGTMDEYCAKAKKEGYDGIEIWWPTEKADQDTLFALLKKHQLEVGFLTAGHESNFKDHFDTFKKMINAAANNKIQKPLFVNCHS